MRHIISILMENELGQIRPYTIKENIAWYELERLRLNLETPDKEI